MLHYLHSAGMHSTYEALRTETLIDDFEVDDPKAKWVGLLEKKWTSVIRLQKKVRRAAMITKDHRAWADVLQRSVGLTPDHGPGVTERSTHG
jgi:hypothetical protein